MKDKEVSDGQEQFWILFLLQSLSLERQNLRSHFTGPTSKLAQVFLSHAVLSQDNLVFADASN
jgi:hypothetical protein